MAVDVLAWREISWIDAFNSSVASATAWTFCERNGDVLRAFIRFVRNSGQPFSGALYLCGGAGDRGHFRHHAGFEIVRQSSRS